MRLAPWFYAWLAVAAVQVLIALWVLEPVRLARRGGDVGLLYQAFIDHFPTTVCSFHRHFATPTPALQTPDIMARFDWLMDQAAGLAGDYLEYRKGSSSWWLGEPQDYYRSGEVRAVRTVLATPRVVESLLARAALYLRPGVNRTLVFSNSDIWFSDGFGASEDDRERVTRRLRKYFPRILYSAKDLELEWLATMPMGLSERYLRSSAPAGALPAIAAARLDGGGGGAAAGGPGRPRRALLCAWDRFNRQENQSGAFPAIAHRIHRGLEAARAGKQAARQWAGTAAARAVGAEVLTVEPRHWWDTLALYRFLLLPEGSGIQTSKMTEALLVLTVPLIYSPAFRPAWADLLQLGFPLVVVRDFAEITAGAMSSWWQSLSPRLPSFRHNCLTSEAFWRIIIGELKSCQ